MNSPIDQARFVDVSGIFSRKLPEYVDRQPKESQVEFLRRLDYITWKADREQVKLHRRGTTLLVFVDVPQMGRDFD